MKGYLTYALAALAVTWGIVGYLAGWATPQEAGAAIWTGLAAFGIRRAIPAQ